jgi:hypothetical protein
MWVKWLYHCIRCQLIIFIMDNTLHGHKISTLRILSSRLTPDIERKKDMLVASRWLAMVSCRAQHSHPNVRVRE